MGGERRPRILFVTHSAGRTGAPLMLLHFLRWLKARGDIEFAIVAVQGGELLREFAALGPTVALTGGTDQGLPEQVARRLGWATENLLPLPDGRWPMKALRGTARAGVLGTLRRRIAALGSFDLAYLNSVHSAPVLPLLPDSLPVITHVHELAYQVDMLPAGELDDLLVRTSHFIAASGWARRMLTEKLRVDPCLIDLAYEFIDVRDDPLDPGAVEAARSELGLRPTSRVVGAVGAAGWIKGSDLIVPLAKRVTRAIADAEFVWVGGARFEWIVREHRYDAERTGLADRVHWAGARADPAPLMALFDVFVLPSRSDTYPLAALEAAAQGKPIVCFDAGGMTEFVRPEERLVVPYLDLDAMAQRVVELLSDAEERQAIGSALAARVRERHSIEVGAPQLLEIIEARLRAGLPASPGTYRG